MAQTTTLRALGLNYSPNALTLPDGSLIDADNIVVRRDNTVESRRGFQDYSQSIGLDTDRAKQLLQYKNKLLVHYGSKIAFDTGTLDSDNKAIFTAFDGLYTETQTGLRIKAIEANKNLYFTSSSGIKKISAKTSADFTSSPAFIRDAGVIKSLNISGELDVTQGQLSGFLTPDSTVAYRVVWGYKDRNDNLILGVPSNRVEVYNYLSDLTALDTNSLCVVLDTLNQTGSLITDGNYASSFYTPINATADTLRANILSLSSKIDNDLHFANTTGTGVPLTISAIELTSNAVKITFSAGDPSKYLSINDYIELVNLPAPFNILNGSQKLDFPPTTTTISFTKVNPTNITSASPVTADINSYNYRHITSAGDDVYIQDLLTLPLSTPATSEQQNIINHTLYRLTERLKIEKSGVILNTLQAKYVTPFIITERANTKLTITIPPSIDSEYFVQVYRTRTFTAFNEQTLGGSGGIPVKPDDEMRLVFEDFPSTAEITAGIKIFNDFSPEALVENNTNLYTNPETGEGILQANEVPPFAKDINTFKNVTFFANTRTRHRIPTFQLLGVSKISNLDKITIASTLGSDTYTFVTGLQEISSVTTSAASALTAGQYFKVYNTAGTEFRFWYEINGIGTEPTATGVVTVKVPVLSSFLADQVKLRTIDVVNTEVYDFQAVSDAAPNTLKITSLLEGKTINASIGTTSSFIVSTFQDGNGEDASSKQILKSSLISAAQAIDQTAQSLIRVINKQSSGIVSAYYVSGDNSPPGQINLESRALSETPFYVVASNSAIGGSFNPDLSPVHTNITSISVANPSVVTAIAHGLVTGDQIIICGSNSTPSIDGERTVAVIDANSFSIPVNVTVAGTVAVWSKVADSAVSTNETKPNRIYYSKANQPEAVPLLHYFPVGAEDKPILRIIPLRSSLLVFKEDGTYRVSGENAPFVTSLLDSSCIVIAPDSIGVTNNVIYAWTLKGITPISENGASAEVSRAIDTEILKLSSNPYPNFSQVTFGLGYNSDSSYTVYTNGQANDTVATIGFRYCTLTNTWTTVSRSQTCATVVKATDKLYMGNAISNNINAERKNFDRTDFSDRDFGINLQTGSLYDNGKTLSFINTNDIEAGDVFVQDQMLSIYQFNSLLIEMDSDPTIGMTSLVSSTGFGKQLTITSNLPHKMVNGDYVTLSGTNSFPSIDGQYQISSVTTSSFVIQIAAPVVSQSSVGVIKRSYELSSSAVSGDSLYSRIQALVIKINNDPGLKSLYSVTGSFTTFSDLRRVFNDIANTLNNDLGATFNSYRLSDLNTPFEAVVTSVDHRLNSVKINLPLQWIFGPIRVYKAIKCSLTFAPATMGDPLNTKQVYESTIMFADRAFTSFTASFSSDLKPEFTPIEFQGSGNGIFGDYSDPGFGYSIFGGQSNSAPFRTYIPRDAQRCRYINVKIDHTVAREIWSLYGISLTGNVGLSSRGYR